MIHKGHGAGFSHGPILSVHHTYGGVNNCYVSILVPNKDPKTARGNSVGWVNVWDFYSKNGEPGSQTMYGDIFYDDIPVDEGVGSVVSPPLPNASRSSGSGTGAVSGNIPKLPPHLKALKHSVEAAKGPWRKRGWQRSY